MQKAYLALALVVTASMVACGREQTPNPNPAAPSVTESHIAGAGVDGTTLKATAPEPVSPVNGIRVEDRRPTLTFKAATGKYAAATFTYRVELMDAGGTRIEEKVVNGFSLVVADDLAVDKDYRWRVRAEWNGAFGPWSATASFKSPQKAVGYITATEIYDPLTDGVSVGTIHGPHTFIPGVGIRLDDFTSHIEYRLDQSLTVGEYSAIITNLSTDGKGIKTKVMSMGESPGPAWRGFGGGDDIVNNDRRMTCEKRNDGTVAWRFITNEQQIDTEGAERVQVPFHESWNYFWRAKWDGGAFDLQIRVDGPDGDVIYDFGKPYRGQYNPNYHFVFAGAPVGNTGPSGATPPGMIIRQIWVSARPRPSWAK